MSTETMQRYRCPKCGSSGAHPANLEPPKCHGCTTEVRMKRISPAGHFEEPVDPVDEFRLYGFSASYHYADDSCKEWGQAAKQKARALKLFDDNPDRQAEMREVAKQFLWSLKDERKP